MADIIYNLKVWLHKKFNYFKKQKKPTIKSIFQKERIRDPAISCSFCNNRLTSITGFYCNYCNKWHCEEHRLPESHNCPRPKLPSEMNQVHIAYDKK